MFDITFIQYLQCIKAATDVTPAILQTLLMSLLKSGNSYAIKSFHNRHYFN